MPMVRTTGRVEGGADVGMAEDGQFIRAATLAA